MAAHPTAGHQSFGLEYQGVPERIEEYFFSLPTARAAGTDGFWVKDPDGNRIEIAIGRGFSQPAPRLKSLALLASDMEASARFYAEILGMEVLPSENGALCKLGMGHLRLVGQSGELVAGAADFCLIADTNIEAVRRELGGAAFVPDLGIVRRHGALGPIRSVYLRDPDGNLVEIAEYVEKRLQA